MPYLGNVEYEVALPVEHVRTLCDTPDELREQHRSHVITGAAYLRSLGSRVYIDPAVGVIGLRASEQRHYDRIMRTAAEVRALTTAEPATPVAPATPSLSNANALALLATY